MIPARHALIALSALLAFGIAAAVWPELTSAWFVALAALGVVAGLDFVWGRLRGVPSVTRVLPGSLAQSVWTTVTLKVENANDSAMRVDLFDHYPAEANADALPLRVALPPNGQASAEYQLRSLRRGPLEFTGCRLRVLSPLKLWWRQIHLPLHQTVRCYPNFSMVRQLLNYEVSQQPVSSGLRVSRRRGEGIEFHQLREYREGDPMRAVDWKATSRMRRLISRDYQDERDQHIVIVLDTGRRMLTRDGDLSHFDHALNALLLLSYLALRQGDSVGILPTGIDRPWLPPVKGVGAINTILNYVYDIEPRPVEVDYAGAATRLSAVQRRRALVVMMTNVREEDSADLQSATQLLRRRHLVMLTSLREHILDETLAAPVHDLDDALAFAATSRYLDMRRKAQSRLASSGLFVDDCLPDQLAATISNRYLAIKRSGQL